MGEGWLLPLPKTTFPLKALRAWHCEDRWTPLGPTCSSAGGAGGGKGVTGRPWRHFAGAAFEGRKFGILAFALQCVSLSLYFIFNLFSALTDRSIRQIGASSLRPRILLFLHRMLYLLTCKFSEFS